MAAAKAVYKMLAEHHEKTGEFLDAERVAEEHGLWLDDEWTHVGHCVLTCLENPKLLGDYRKGNGKVLDVLVGKAIRASNMTVDASLVRELMPLIIERHFKDPP